ncbi:MAG: multicopper oxidase domain-containing protein [Kiritimatiellae bacterium]|nr:multicopper oxidase domain-containing protein [Kiritimatiellia bacterium]
MPSEAIADGFRIPLGNTEIWRFENLSQLAHPMHIHDVQFNILRVDGLAPAANQTGWKDTVLVYPGSTVEVLAAFTDFSDPINTYMMHCHSLNHEDNGMMEQFVVIDVGTAGFTLDLSSLIIEEDGGSTDFTVVLDVQPNSNVMLTVSSSATGEATISPTALTFASNTWSTT